MSEFVIDKKQKNCTAMYYSHIIPSWESKLLDKK